MRTASAIWPSATTSGRTRPPLLRLPMNWNPGRTSSRKSLRHAATTLATASLLALVIASAWTPVAHAASPSQTTFADIVAESKLIVLAEIHERADGGFTFTVEQVLKGRAGNQLAYPPLAATPPFQGWTRAVIAFADPSTDDFRAPTIAWHVASDGTIDPERFQRYPGLPATLSAMLAYFALPATDMAASAHASGGGPDTLTIALLAGLVAAAFVAWRPGGG